LGWEFEKYADGLVTSLWWHRGRCLSYGDGVAFWALAEMVRQRFGIAEDDPTAIAAEKLAAALPSYVSDASERDYVAPRLASLLGIETATAATLPREELFAGWRLFFERLAATEPVVMLFEDLQYADSGLLDFLDHLLDWARDVPIFVLTLARPEIEDRRPGWGAGRRNSTSLTLEPLDATAMSAMLDGLVPGMPPAARESVAMQAQGMPLYAVETIRMLVDREVVRPIDGVYRLIGDLGELSVPDTLQLLLAARLDALPPDARRLVADAAVLGGSFSPEALAAVSDEPVDRVRDDLADLVRREVLEVKADPLSPNRGQYAFVQTMFRQVAYDTLSRRERKARHLAVADHLSRAFADGGEELSEVIASHLLDALSAVPDDPDVAEIRDRTISTLTRAGERAVELTAQLLDSAAVSATRSGDLTASVDLHLQAADAYRRGGNVRKAARSESRAGRSLGRTDVTAARDLMQKACAVLEEPADEDTAMSVGDLAFLALSNGWAEGDELILRALELAQGLDLAASHIADLLIVRGIGHSVRGRQAQALANYREARRMAEAIGDSATVARASMNLSDAAKFFNPDEAAAHGFEALALCRRIGNGFYLSTATGNLLLALVMADWSAADRLLEEFDEDDRLTGDSASGVPALISIVLRGRAVPAELEALAKDMMASKDLQDRATSHLASAALAKSRGDTAAVAAEAQRALDTGAALPAGHEVIVWAWTFAADAAIDLGDVDEATRLLDWLATQPVGHVPPFLRAERKRIDGRVRAARGDGTAGDVLDEAVVAMRHFGSDFHLAVALLDRADALTGADPERAQQLADEAMDLAKRLGAGSLAARLTPYGHAFAGAG
jgi:tetratricopeptide (TPR) repeat protein